MTRQSLAHAQRATPAQPEPLIQCLARLENISHSRVSQPVYHAKQVLIVAQSDSRAQVELVRMAMSALKDPSSPSHSTMSLEDCATLAITARAERSKSVIRVLMPLSRVCLLVISVLLDTTVMIQRVQLIQLSAPLSTTVQEDQPRPLLALQVIILRYSNQVLKPVSNAPLVQPGTTVKMESSTPPSNVTQDTSASPGHHLPTRRRTSARWVSGAKREL